MPELRLLVDAEALVIDYLLTVDDLTPLVAGRIGSRKDKPYPRLTITRLGGRPGPQPAHLDSARIQVEAWADTKTVANTVARTAQAALFKIVDAAHEAGVVTDSECVLGPSWVPDPLTSTPRYVLDFIVRVHPLPSS